MFQNSAPDPDQKLLPQNLFKMYRQRTRLTQLELAHLLGLKSYQAISYWEEGRSLPRPQNLRQLIEIYLTKGVWGAGNEQAEARQLWRAVKDLHDNEKPEVSTTYVVFDEHWFAGLLQKRRASTTSPSSTIPAPVSSKPALTSPPLLAGKLPLPLTSLVGREQELRQLRALLTQVGLRLITLTGPGGTGKTRLALQLAYILRGSFEHGSFFVELAGISEPALVPSLIARTLGLREPEDGSSLLNYLKAYLSDKRMLLVLDNFEQISEAGPLVAELLTAAPNLKVLVTSREVLQIYGEQSFEVLPLGLPDRSQVTGWQRQPGLGAAELALLSQSPAVTLFIERAQAIKPDFKLNKENWLAIAELCFKLDGLPLALELAAVHVRVLPPQQLISRLSNWLGVLVGGSRDLPARHRTLQATIDWSYQQLNEAEQRLFRRLAVFVGGWSLEAAEALGQPETEASGPGVWQTLEALINKSLVRPVEVGELGPRFTFLEIFREYALHRLCESSEQVEEAARRQHASFYLALAQKAEPELMGAQQSYYANLLELEHENLRAALEWYKRRGEWVAELELVAALRRFWQLRGYFSEGRQWLSRVLDLVQSAELERQPTLLSLYNQVIFGAGLLALRQADYAYVINLSEKGLALNRAAGHSEGQAQTLLMLGEVTRRQADYAKALIYLEESLVLHRALNDLPGAAICLTNLALVAYDQGEYQRARLSQVEALHLAQATGSKWSIAMCLNGLGLIVSAQSDYPQARRLFLESLALNEELGNKTDLAHSYNNLGKLAEIEGDYEEAASLYQESLAINRSLTDKAGVAWSLNNLGRLLGKQGQTAQALAWLAQSLQLNQELEAKQGQAEALADLVGLLSVQPGQLGQAASLAGAMESLLEGCRGRLHSIHLMDYEKTVARLQRELGEEEFRRVWQAGRTLSFDEALGRIGGRES